MGWWCVFISYFVLQDNTVENLARDWFADVQLIDIGSGETFNMSGPSTARFENGFAVFEGVIFLFEGRNFQLEFTVQGGWSGKCDQICSSTSYHSFMIIDLIQFPADALKNFEFGEELHYFFPTQHWTRKPPSDSKVTNILSWPGLYSLRASIRSFTVPMLMALTYHNQKMLLSSANQQLFFTTATIFSSVLYVDHDFHNNLFMEIFVGRFSISSNYFDGTLMVSKN